MNQGQNAKVTAPIEYIPRQHRLGLGAKPLTLEQIKKMGDDFDRETLHKRKAVTEEYAQGSGDGAKNYKSIHEKL